MRTRQYRRVIALLALVSLTAAACGSDDDSSDSTEAGSGSTAADAGAAGGEKVTLTISHNDGPADSLQIETLAKLYTDAHPNVTFEMDTFPADQNDNIVKTRLATGEMGDVFLYNSGALLQAISPDRSVEPLTGDEALATVSDTFLPAVTYQGEVYGVPLGPGLAGGILYNKDVFAKVGIEPPKTWAEFEENNEKLKEAGVPPLVGTFADPWTAQLFVLADFYNVQAQVPNFADDYTANKAHYADTPAALAGFEKLAESADKDWYQPDYESTTHDEGLGILARGEAAQYPMLSVVVPAMDKNTPGSAQKIGFFALPSDDAAINGATIWLPNALYIAKDSDHKDVALDFMRFITSLDTTTKVMAEIPPTGPMVLNGVTLPDTVLPMVTEIQAYVDSGNAAPALEFVSPVKGPALPQIAVEVGSGLRSAEDGAKTYDDDVEKQAKQLGLPGW